MYTWDPQGNSNSWRWPRPPSSGRDGERGEFRGSQKEDHRGEVFVETPYKQRFPLGSVNVHFPYKTVTLAISRAAPVPVVSQKWPAPVIIMAEACFGRHIPCLWAHRARLWQRKQSQDPGRKATILPNHPTLALSHRVQKTVLYTSLSLLLSHIQGYRYHLSKFHINALYCIGIFLSGLLHSV